MISPLYLTKICDLELFRYLTWTYLSTFYIEHLLLLTVFYFQTGNHKGWAFVLFTDSEVAQLAAEAMDGYLMFEKRLEC